MANLEYYDTHCCALEEINRLADFDGNPKGAMVDFCKANLGRRVEWKIRQKSGDYGAEGALFSFYFFTAAVHHGTSKSYGSQFAKFIEDEGLGKVITTPVMANMAYHKDHGNQVWIWIPDVKALNKWWETNQPPKALRKKES